MSITQLITEKLNNRGKKIKIEILKSTNKVLGKCCLLSHNLLAETRIQFELSTHAISNGLIRPLDLWFYIHQQLILKLIKNCTIPFECLQIFLQ